MKTRTVTAAAVLGALLVPAAAEAATKPVFRGTPPKLAKGTPDVAFDAAYYPSRITIAAGDKLRINGGDTMFVPKGADVPGLIVPAGSNVSGAKDAAGADLWFNGRPNLTVNGRLLAPAGGKAVDGSRFVSSGLGFEGPPKPFVVRFPKAGTYTLRSVFSSSVRLTVVVKPRGTRVPSAAADSRRIARQAKASKRVAKRLAAGRSASGAPAPTGGGQSGGHTVKAGNDAGSIATIAFFPATTTVKAGETVTFTMSDTSIETHNVAFGPKAYLDEHAKTFFGPVLNPFVTYRSERPGTPIAFDGANHGNGWVNTGLIDAGPSPLPSSDSVTFSKPGTYAYYCAVHGNEMTGTIKVVQ
jgi:plastocyanin